MTVFVKFSGDTLPTIQIVLIRGIFSLIVTRIFIFRENIYPLGENKLLLITRGLTGTVALFFVYESIKRYPLAEATAIQYLFPIFTALVASLLIFEPISKKVFLAVIIGFLGVFTMLDFPFLSNNADVNLISIFIAISGSLLTGISYVLVRKATLLNEHPLVVMYYFPLFTVPLSAPLAYYYWVNPSIEAWVFLLLVGIFTQSGQFFLTHGYKELPAAQAAPLSYIQVPIATVIGLLLFDEKITMTFILGSLMILLSIFIVITKRQAKG
tara:strand:- start:686 stop:1492 length:807 start_codon:yes stop_codon:yes gene_type:complete